jgi:serine/threonine protein kinase
MKKLKKAEVIRLQQVEHMISEKSILAILDHPFIVNLSGTFQDKRYLYMVLEYVIGGEFFTHLRKAGRFENASAKFYAAQIVMIFEYLHSQDFIYRDLKPENLLLDNTGYLKITDFGFAKQVAFKTYTLCGTPEYIAPEVLLNKGHGKGVDWWTLGILIFEMLAGQPPFVDDDPMNIYHQILAGKVNFPRYFDRNAKNLIKKLLSADLTKRYGCLKGGALDIKKHRWFSGTDW